MTPPARHPRGELHLIAHDLDARLSDVAASGIARLDAVLGSYAAFGEYLIGRDGGDSTTPSD